MGYRFLVNTSVLAIRGTLSGREFSRAEVDAEILRQKEACRAHHEIMEDWYYSLDLIMASCRFCESQVQSWPDHSDGWVVYIKEYADRIGGRLNVETGEFECKSHRTDIVGDRVFVFNDRRVRWGGDRISINSGARGPYTTVEGRFALQDVPYLLANLTSLGLGAGWENHLDRKGKIDEDLLRKELANLRDGHAKIFYRHW